MGGDQVIVEEDRVGARVADTADPRSPQASSEELAEGNRAGRLASLAPCTVATQAFTVRPSSTQPRTPRLARVRLRARSLPRRLISSRRVVGTMQKLQNMSQPSITVR